MSEEFEARTWKDLGEEYGEEMGERRGGGTW